MSQTTESLRNWFRHVEPIYPELFNAAHVMCGSYELAEYALQNALLDVWFQGSGGVGFRERLRGALRQSALEALEQSDDGAEFTWTGLSAGAGDPLRTQLASETVELQRQVVLRYGCGLSSHAIARLTNIPVKGVRTNLSRFVSRCRRRLSGAERRRVETRLMACARAVLTSTAGIPPVARVYRTFETEASRESGSGHKVALVFSRVLLVLAALFCVAAFWLFAVLVQPPDTSQPASHAPALQNIP